MSPSGLWAFLCLGSSPCSSCFCQRAVFTTHFPFILCTTSVCAFMDGPASASLVSVLTFLSSLSLPFFPCASPTWAPRSDWVQPSSRDCFPTSWGTHRRGLTYSHLLSLCISDGPVVFPTQDHCSFFVF